ncbi:MAG: acyl-CoA/acyl-ACP dehydrogenase [Rhodospirillaceae bacterium]|nr:acyl-CoA/acyl-ACP dehydrogenase [Rhodospirillaceae bacterium]
MSELTQILADTAERLLTDHATKAVLLESEQGTWPKELWQALEENGLTQPLVPEDKGGVGAGWEDAFVIAFAAGRHRTPVPLTETMAAGWLLSRLGLDIPSGPLSLIDDGHQLEFVDGRISGQAQGAPWAKQAGQALTNIKFDGGWRVAHMAIDQASVTPDLSIAAEPRDHLNFDSAAPQASAAFPAPTALAPIRLLGALIRSAEMAGGLGRAVEMSVSYVTERQQFGRALAKFQAIQQMLAVAAARAAEARMAAEFAFGAMDRSNGDLEQAEFDIAAAKIICGEAVETVTDITHQVHGAIGFTHEHELHFTTRRLWAWRGEFGAETFWAERLGRAVMARGADKLWPDLTARQSRG